ATATATATELDIEVVLVDVDPVAAVALGDVPGELMDALVVGPVPGRDVGVMGVGDAVPQRVVDHVRHGDGCVGVVAGQVADAGVGTAVDGGLVAQRVQLCGPRGEELHRGPGPARCVGLHVVVDRRPRPEAQRPG